MRRGEQLEAVSRLPGILGHSQHVPVRDERGMRRVEPIHNQELPENPETRVFATMSGHPEHRLEILLSLFGREGGLFDSRPCI